MNTVLKIAAAGVAVASDLLGVTVSGLIYTPWVYDVIHAGAKRRKSHATVLENH